MTPLSLLLIALTAEAHRPKQTPQEQVLMVIDQTMARSVAGARAAAEGAPGDTAQVYAWAGALSAAAEAGTVARGGIDELALDSFFAAVEGIAADTTYGADTVGIASSVALAAGRKGQALVLAEQALASKPTNAALLTWFAVSNTPSDAPAHCVAALTAAASDAQRFDTLTTCNAVLGSDWAAADQQAWFAEESARRSASQTAHTQQLQADLVQRAAEMEAAHAAWEASRPAEETAAASAGSSTVGVHLKVTCDEKVRMFEGSSPTSSGTYGWQSANSVRSLTVRAGDVLCIADDHDRVGACWTASGEQAELELGCDDLVQK